MPEPLDALTLMRDLRPDPGKARFDPSGTRAVTALERIVTSPPAPRRRAGRRRRSAALVAGLAVMAVAAAVIAPVLRGPDVLADVAKAADALSKPGGIYHFKMRRYNADGFYGASEVWHTADGRRTRIRFSSGLESVMDFDRRFQGSYNPQTDTVVRQVYEGQWDRPPRALDTPAFSATENVGNLTRILKRAKDGTGDVRLVGETTIRGIPVYELRFDFRDAQANLSRTIYVDRERHLPVRVIEGEIVDDYLELERVPSTAENLSLTTMGRHPGAKYILEDDF